MQDGDGNDLDIFYKLSDVFADNEKKIITVIQARVDRDVSIPVTSHLRPAEAFHRPRPPLFDAQPYSNLDPDRPVSSTERLFEDEEDEDDPGSGGRQQNDGLQVEEDLNDHLVMPNRGQTTRNMEATPGFGGYLNPMLVKSSIQIQAAC